MKKYILGVVLVFVMVFAFTPVAKAATLSDLMTQIKILQKQVVELSSQATALVLKSASSVSTAITKNTVTKSGVTNGPSDTPCTTTTIPWIKVLSPNGGETFTAGQQMNVTWDSCNISTQTQIWINLYYYSVGGSSSWGPAGITFPNSGSALLTLPSATSTFFQPGSTKFGTHFKIEVFTTPTVSPVQHDLSDSLFTIVSPCNNYVYNSQIGNLEGGPSGNGSFFYAEYVVVDSMGYSYIKDMQHVQKFSPTGVFVAQYNTGALNKGLSIDSSGNIFVAVNNYSNPHIQKLTSNLVPISQFGGYGLGNGQFHYISGVTIDSSNNIYVVDAGNNRIQKFNSAGVFLSKFGGYGSGNGKFNGPNGVAIDSSDNIYVVDTGNHRIQKFNSAGVFLSKFGGPGSGDGQFDNPYGIAIDSFGYIYVTDENNYRVQKFDSNNVYVSKFGNNSIFSQGGISGITINSAGDIFVVNHYHVKKFNSLCVVCKNTSMIGDVDGNSHINLMDALLIGKIFSGEATLLSSNNCCADVDGDNIIDLTDSNLVSNYFVGLTPTGNAGVMCNAT